jgi:HD-like signal output (HDOD) protein
MDRTEVLRKIAAEVEGGEVNFPTSAQVALKLQHALDDPDCHVEAATKLIKAEPLLAAKVVALANSAAFNSAGREITDVRAAVSRLGFRNIRALAAAVVTRQLAGRPSTAQGDLATRLWEHTAHVAALAHVIARRVTRQDPETAMFAGIVHEVGGFYMISRAKDYPGLFEAGFSAWAENGEADVGRAVLKVLGVPEAVVAAIDVVWQGFLALPPVSLGDTLLLADELSPVPSPLRLSDADGGPGRAGMAASIDLLIGQDTLAEILAESAETVASLTAALRF